MTMSLDCMNEVAVTRSCRCVVVVVAGWPGSLGFMAAGPASPQLPGVPGGSAAAVTGAQARIRGHAGVALVPVDHLRLEHFTESVPWRRPGSRRGQAHLPGCYWAATVADHVVYESRLELERLLLADFDPAVTAIFAQPCLLTGVVGGVRRRHVPDFLFASADGAVTVVNVKPAARLLVPKVAQALAWPGAVFEAHGWGYEVWSGAERVLVENVRFLAGYRRRGLVDEAQLENALAEMVDGEPLGAAERRLAGSGPAWQMRPVLLALLWRHRLVTDLSRPLSAASVLRRC
jgi:hypothetical protein